LEDTMSMHGSFIMIQGNHIASLPEVFSRFKYTTTNPPRLIYGWKGTLNALEYPTKGKPKTIVYKAACYVNNWTVIYDPEMLMVNDEIACSNVSNWLNTRIFGMICEGASNTYAYIYCNENLTRSYWIGDGEVFKDSGEKFPEEPAIQSIGEHDVVEIMSQLGVDLKELEEVNDFYLFEFDESSIGTSEPVKIIPTDTSRTKKPWWRF
jgi:hypothetical protein